MKRRVKKKADARVTQPKLIKQYNLEMGGVDVMDRLLGTYRPMIRGKKWYWPFGNKCHQCFRGSCVEL